MNIDQQNKSNKALLRIREFLFFISFGVFLIRRLFTDVTLWHFSFDFFWDFREKMEMIYDEYIPIVLLACIAFMLFTTVPKLSRIIVFAALIFVGKMVSIANEDMHMYIMMLLIVAAYEISAKKIFIFTIGLNIPPLIATIVASQRGVIENRIDPGRNREYLGYNWTTTPMMIFSYALFGYLILRKGKITIWEYLIFNGINAWFFYKTNTRFAFLLVFLVLTFLMVYRLIREQDVPRRLIRNICILVPHLCFIFIYVITMMYNPDIGIMAKLNRLLSNRFAQCQYAINLYGYLPFGQPIQWVTIGQSTPDNPPTYVDTAYLQTMLKYGVVSLIVLLLISSYIMYRSFSCKTYSVAIVFCFLLVFGLFEQQPYWVEYNTILLLTFADWSKIQDAKASLPQLELKHQY